MKIVNLKFKDESIHKMLKSIAVDESISLQDLLLKICIDFLKKSGKIGPEKSEKKP